MPRLSWVLILVCACCSGDNSHQPTTLGPAPVGAGSATVPTTAPAPEKPGAVAPLDESMATPYFQSGPAAEGAGAFALEKWPQALAGFTAARKTAKGDDAHRLDLMIGLTHARLDNWPKAAEHLGKALAGIPLLADYLRYQTARALYFAHDTTKALELARQVSPDAIYAPDAELLVGDIYRGMSDHAKVAAHYKDYLTRRPRGMRRSESRFRLAEALAKTGGDPREIVELYRRIGIDDPLSSWTTKAHERLTALAPTLPAALRKFETLTAAEHIDRGMELFDAMRNPESEAAFAAALADPAISVADKCIAAYHAAQSRFKERDRKGAAPMFDTAAIACKAAKNTDLEIKSHYQAGRSWSFIGQHAVATQRYQTAQTVDPSHSYSDDALLREGEEWWSRGDAKQVEAVLSSLPAKFPKGDMVAEAMWRLGFAAWRAQRYDDAIKWWTKQIQLVPHDDNWYGAGQPQYWLGRAYAKKGKTKDSLASYESAIRKYPAAYYALLSLNRLREAAPRRYEAMVAEISADPPDYDPKAPAFTFKPRVEWGSPGFARALEFLRLGLGDSAEAELRKLGLAAPGGKQRVDDPDRIEKLWAMAFLFDKAGSHGAALWPTRWHILDYRKQWPVGANRARWLIAYPKAFEELLARHAKINNVPFAMQIAIVREESGFNPLLESYANAIGLTQMIFVTGKRFAKGTGIAATRENLRDPEKNVTIGSRFLGHLFSYWKDFVALVPASYNGGEGYVRRNLRTRGTWDVDEFIEGIVGDQVRNYSKRVLGTYFTYSWLYEKTVPVIPNKIPTNLIPKN
jgi:soluble lytic murein transglycosylase